ncbi:hypothetical protein J31TS4_03560 [Paenibacillus sp. J31TS4]|uniref:phosphodiester glycosidase family protein n=1 Tax=Paenibacillus sp. J31TS4 TaxID=2807195 RepID=UPI001B2159B1|nr:phosphodiester glycosidase family protein [Paenibacillus sp. J31TS4]GIP37076.1 hypothetical protein J31TS4_03560 [Paenibacillus sp. J31TS4]
MAQQHNSDGHRVVGAVNLDFFAATGVPTGLQITNGEIRTAPNLGRTFFAVKKDGTVQIGGEVSINSYIRTDNGESLQVYAVNKLREQRHTNHAFLYTERFDESTGAVGEGVEVLITPDDPSAILKPGEPVRGMVEAVYSTTDNPIPAGKFVLSASGSKASWITSHLKVGTSVTFGVDLDNGLNDAQYAVAGWSGLAKVLLHNGEVSSQVDDSTVNNVVVPNPRTFLATKNGQLYVVTFDGRQPGYADGVTLREGAEYLQSLGMEEAINMDGGGSTTLLLKEPGDEELSLANLPSDGKERAIGNALLIVSTHPHFGR